MVRTRARDNLKKRKILHQSQVRGDVRIVNRDIILFIMVQDSQKNPMIYTLFSFPLRCQPTILSLFLSFGDADPTIWQDLCQDKSSKLAIWVEIFSLVGPGEWLWSIQVKSLLTGEHRVKMTAKKSDQAALTEPVPEASWRRVFDPSFFGLYHYLEQNGDFLLVPKHIPGPSSQVLPAVSTPAGF